MSESTRNFRWPVPVAAILIGCYLAQIWISMIGKSATYDEQVYVLAGFSYLETGEYSLKQDAPPLIPLLSAAMVKIYQAAGNEIQLDEKIGRELPRIKKLWQERSFQSTEEYELAREFFYANNGPRLIQIARIPIGLLAAVLAIYLFRFARLLFGDTPAIAALLLLVLDPNLIGHARVVSADLGLACFFLMAHFYHYRCLTEKRFRHVVMLTVSTTLCICVKLSGLIVLPSLFLVSVVALVWPSSQIVDGLKVDQKTYRNTLITKAIASIVFIGISTWLMLSALYQGFDSPMVFRESMQLIYSNVPDDYLSYLNGHFQNKFWHYYPLAIYYKTPISTALLFTGSLFLFSSDHPLGRWFCWCPILVAMTISAFDEINIGLRRVLLVLPFVYLSLAGVFAYGLAVAGKRKWVISAVGCISVVWAVFSAAMTYPNHLNFFNQAIGGPENGYRHLSESNLSWGQNLPQLKRYLDEQQIDEVVMHCYGWDDPRSYGINNAGFNLYHLYWPLQKVYVFSGHSLIQFSKNEDQGCNWFERFVPDKVVGETMYVFDLRASQEADREPLESLRIARSFVGKKQLSNSIAHFQNYLAFYPDDKKVHRELAEVAEEFKHHDLAIFHRELAKE